MRVTSKVADRLEQLIAVIFYGFLFVRLVQSGLPNLQVWAVLVADGTILAFLLVRRPTQGISTSLADWLVAVVGTTVALMIRPVQPPIDADTGLILMLIGTGIAIAAKFALRRSFGLVAANRGVKVDGPYGVVRHPMYAGYMVSHIGMLLMLPSLWNVGVYAVSWTALALRVRAEERLLLKDETYAAYAKRVRWRLIPGLF